MRQTDLLPGGTGPETAPTQRLRDYEGNSNGTSLPQVQVQGFQNHERSSSRRPSIANVSIPPRMKANTTPSMPDLYQRIKQVPLRSRSAIFTV